MSDDEKTLCRLCISMRCKEYKSLYDENGQGNNVYEITLKYFDPIVLLSPADEHDSQVICVECWHHISEFYGFQQSVLQAQADFQIKLQHDVKVALEAEVKVEDEIPLEEPMPIGVVLETADIIHNDDLKDEKDMSDMDMHDFNGDDNLENPFSDDDKPLIAHIKKARKKRCSKKQDAQDAIENMKEKSIKPKKERKPRTTNQVKKAKGEKRKRTLKKATEVEDMDSDLQQNKEHSLDGRDASSNNEMDDSFAEGSNNERKSVKDKTVECDAFIAQWKQELECACCSATVANFTLLRKHFTSEHPNEKCYVICCQRRFYHRFHIVEHIRLHIDPNAFKCDECGRCSTNSRNLAKHKREMHTEEGKQRPFECKECHKFFSNKTILRTHMEVHESGRDHICSECGKGFPSENRRKIHERMVHQADRICDQCGKTIHGVYALKLHLLEHAGVQKPKWPCDQCNALLNSNSSLKRHKLITHHDGSTVYICSECGKVFTSENALRSHKRISHLLQRKFKCNICEKAFKFPKILREHMASHTGEDLYQCPYCPKTFKVSANLHHHRKKAHPAEWAEARINKPVSKKVDISLVSNEIVM